MLPENRPDPRKAAEPGVPPAPGTMPPAPARPQPAAGENPGRLPDGAKFKVVYDAARTQWTGTLTIGGQAFTGSAGGLFTLLNRLDRQYRQTLPAAAPKNPG